MWQVAACVAGPARVTRTASTACSPAAVPASRRWRPARRGHRRTRRRNPSPTSPRPASRPSVDTSVSVVSSPRSMASVTAQCTNAREVFSELCSSRLSSGWRCDSSTDVTRNAAADRSRESACMAAEKKADSRFSSDVSHLGLGHARGNHHLVGLLDHFAVQHSLACEVVIDRRAGQIRTYRDCLECRCVVTEFAENLASGAHDALTGLSRLRCRRTARTPGRGIRHSQIVPHVT